MGESALNSLLMFEEAFLQPGREENVNGDQMRAK